MTQNYEYSGAGRQRPRPVSRKRKKRRAFALLFTVVLLVFVAILLVHDSNNRIVTTTYTVEKSSIPSGFDGYRIVQLSDLHGAEFGDNNQKLLSAVAEASPDIIVLTGDLVDADTASPEKYAETLISDLAAIAPVYYVTGNHEWGSGTARDIFSVIDNIENADYLRNRYIYLENGGDKLLLAGIDDPNGLRDQKTLPEVREDIRESGYEGFTLLLAHRNNIETYDGQDVDLVITGHGHGGIIRLPFTDGIISADREWFPENMSGLCPMSDGGVMLVSRGLGNNPYSMRLFNNPEITVTVLKSK